MDQQKQCVRCGGSGHDSSECRLPAVGSNDNRPAVRLYLAGPMSNLPANNYPAFHAAAAKLRALGYHVENPAECDLDPATTTWHHYMRHGIAKLLKCDAVVLLPGWIHSRGAKTEFMLATNLDMPVFDCARLLQEGRAA